MTDRYAELCNAMRNSNEAAHAALGLLRGLYGTHELPLHCVEQARGIIEQADRAKAVIERDPPEVNL